MSFKAMRDELISHYTKMVKRSSKPMFATGVDKDVLWNLYLDSFPEGTNDIFRERRSHDCSCCRHFIKTVGNAVFIENNEVHTIWEFKPSDPTYVPVVKALDSYVKSCPISDVFVFKENHYGTKTNFEETVENHIITWEHFFLEVPENMVNRSSESIGEIQGEYRDIRNVFKRSLDDITMDAVLTVMELIDSNTLYRGSEWKYAIKTFKKFKEEYDKLSKKQQEIFAWDKSIQAGDVVGKIRNHSIGVLLVDISTGRNLEDAVSAYEAIVAPANYKRPKAIFTKKMLETAKQTVQDLGYSNSLGRRFATMDDITVNNIIFANRDAYQQIRKSDDVFSEMSNEVGSVSPKKLKRVEEIGIEDFIKNVVPNAKTIELLLENRHEKNLVSLLAPKDPTAPSMFKWNNPFCWTYHGNIADSDIKQNVEKAGGNVHGELRFSIQWNDTKTFNESDYDAHCVFGRNHICYFYKNADGGSLDVDITHPNRGVPAVENIVWADKSLRPTTYHFFVVCFCGRQGNKGFKAEIEFGGSIYQFEYRQNIPTGKEIPVADVTVNRDGTFTMVNYLPYSESNYSKAIWGLNTNNFIPVTLMMYSPNYWDEQKGIGNKHYMFMLDKCVNDENPNAFYNEYLKPELNKHRKVFEALGNRLAVENVDNQLSGLGFSSTLRNDVVVKVTGNVERIMRIKF